MIRTLTIAAFAAGTLALPAAAVEDLTINITYPAELLETNTGAQTVYEEISEAAEEVCEQSNPTERLRYMLASKKCEAEALDTAVARIDAPRLTAIHAAANG